MIIYNLGGRAFLSTTAGSIITNVCHLNVSPLAVYNFPCNVRKEFKTHFTEREANYVEKITVHEENDLEYLHVPAHDGLTDDTETSLLSFFANLYC